MRPRTAKQRALATVRALADSYPAACELQHKNPLELLVATILSAQTTDQRVNSVTPTLFAAMKSAQDYASADSTALEEIIRPTGFFHSKARALIGMGQLLVAEFDGRVPDTMEDLTRLPGVGRKTANVILGVGFGKPGFAVDTHVTRLTKRLGLVKTTDPKRIEREVCAMVPPVEWTGLSLRLILHGRRVCAARRPRCEACVLEGWCPSSTLKAASGRRGVSGPGRSGEAGARGRRSSPRSRSR